MRNLKNLLLVGVLGLGLGLLATPSANAQVSVGVGVGPAYGGYEAYGAPPACTYGYYPYAPYSCAPYGYYGPDYFYNGIFIGVGPWFGWGWGHGFRGVGP